MSKKSQSSTTASEAASAQAQATSPLEKSVEEYFGDLDANFINLKQIEDDTFQYHAQDVLIQSHWELPLVIQYPNSVVQYKFASSPVSFTICSNCIYADSLFQLVQGDLSFGIMFVAALEEGQTEDDIEVETFEPVMRTNSGEEMVEGDLEIDSGVIFFIWDNDFDWFSNKYLSYTIQVKQVRRISLFIGE